jgi:signal transduction histidine kinase
MRQLRRLPLLWRLLIPSLVVTLVLGSAGSFVLVRYLHRGAQESLDRKLFTDAVSAEVQIRDQTLALLESLRLASNLEGVPEALAAHDRSKLSSLLAGVPALHSHLDLLVAVDGAGAGVVELRRDGDTVTNTVGSPWTQTLVAEAHTGATDASGDKRAGLLTDRGATLLAVATPVRTDHVVGVIVAGEQLSRIVTETATRLEASVAISALDGRVLASSGPKAKDPVLPVERARARRASAPGGEREFVDSPLTLRNEEVVATLTTGLATAPFFSSVRGGEARVVGLVVLAMVGVVALAVLLSRFVTRQMRPLVEANRALGRGELTARAPVLADDELGEVAAGLNLMAEQLQASYAELEMRVAARTEELQRVYDELNAVLAARTDVFAAVSHEFRSPLFAILGHADLMADPNFRPPNKRWRAEFATTLRESAQMLLGRVNELLNIARIESGAVELDLEGVAIADVVADIRGTVRALARRGDLTFTIEIAPNLPLIHADRQRLREIVMNLLSNAIKYTPAGGKVTLLVGGDDEHVCIRVADTGVGIPAEIGERIFEPFYRVRGVEAQGGQASTGLGLALVQRLVRAHEGEVGFECEPGRGTTFTVTLPARNRASAGSDAADRTVTVKAYRTPSEEETNGYSRHADCLHADSLRDGLTKKGPRRPAPTGSVA